LVSFVCDADDLRKAVIGSTWSAVRDRVIPLCSGTCLNNGFPVNDWPNIGLLQQQMM